MVKIKDMHVGETVSTALLVKSAEIRLTKAKKPYLLAELTDGTDTIQAQDWEFGNNQPPAKNTVLDITATVTEYMGNKQLTLLTMKPSNVSIETFAPSGDVDVEEYVARAKALIASITNPYARDIVLQVFSDNAMLWKTIPGAKGVHHAFVSGLLKHTVDVATKAKAIAELTPMCNVDLVVAGALLHDMGKLWTYELNGAFIDMTDQGQMLEHIMLGAMKLEKYRTPENSAVLDLILHIISSHHGELEYGSPTTPRFLEAVIVHYADSIDAKTQIILEANSKVNSDAKFTDKIWTLGNKQMFTQYYVQEVMQ